MDFLGLLKDIVSIVVIANAVTGHKDKNMTEDYANQLKEILETPTND